MLTIRARSFLRKMRGRAQAHLLRADDGLTYVVKFRNNPQGGRRILINEFLASAILRHLGLPTPEPALVHVTPEFLDMNREVHFTLGSRRVAVDVGWHFGSQYPGDPERTAVYDFLPQGVLQRVTNLKDFLAALVIDKWIGNADGRQCVFYRAPIRGSGEQTTGWFMSMIDHGLAFDGARWEFLESAVQGLYPRKEVYEQVRSLDDFQPWLERVTHFPDQVIRQAQKNVPHSWFDGDQEALDKLLNKLIRRQERVPELVRVCRGANVFPNWSEAATAASDPCRGDGLVQNYITKGAT